MRIVLAMTVLAGLCVTSAAEPARKADSKPKGSAEEFKKLPALTAALGKATKVVLHEGLPHQTFEPKLLEQELKTKKTVKVHGFPFYQETLSLKEADAKKLTALFRAGESFTAYRGPKKCGGFHPDYAVEWRLGKDVYQALVCFGCHEVKFYGPKAGVYCDVRDRALGEMKKVLLSYRKNRPEKK
jgi:hypothetical protein